MVPSRGDGLGIVYWHGTKRERHGRGCGDPHEGRVEQGLSPLVSRFREGSCFEQGEINGPFVFLAYGAPRQPRVITGACTTGVNNFLPPALGRICSARTALPRAHALFAQHAKEEEAC